MCWFSYAAAYLCRVNYSVSMPYLMAEYGWDKAHAGVVAGGFFWAYACGQLINGIIGDRFSPRWFVGSGIAVAGIANLLIPYAGGNWIPVLWTVNGFFQSMLWGPIMRIVSSVTGDDGKEKSRAATIMSTSFVVGSFAAYSIAGRIAAFSWQAVYWIPGLIMLLCAAVWVIVIPKNIALPDVSSEKKTKPTESFWKFALMNGLFITGTVCLLHGVIRESITVWGPMILSETYTVPYQEAVGYFAAIPVFQFSGVLFSYWLNRRISGPLSLVITLLFILCGTFSCALAVTLNLNLYLSLALMAVIAALITTVNCTLLAFVPLSGKKENRVSGIAGFLDFTAYMGAALASIFTGIISSGEWKTVPAFWFFFCLAAIVLTQRLRKTQKNKAYL